MKLRRKVKGNEEKGKTEVKKTYWGKSDIKVLRLVKETSKETDLKVTDNCIQ